MATGDDSDVRRATPGPNEETLQARPRTAADGLYVVALGEDLSASAPLPRRGRLVIGRSPDADLRVDHASVSREHAALEVTEGAVVLLRDLGSKNGTRVGGERIEPERAVELAEGVVAELGDVMVVVKARAAEERPSPPSVSVARSARGPHFGAAMQPILALLDRVAPDDIPVLLLGETGAGKEVLAERLHTRSRRNAKPLLRLHAAALAPSVLESELFGHERGAFTGAAATKAGLLETADGGTVFIDEVGELPLDVQVKLLRVLEDKTVLRVGALKPRVIDVRFVAATNRELAEEVTRGAFRQDLYYRLSGITITIPPLRERRDEIAELSRRFVADASAARGLDPPAIDPRALDKLRAHGWPGNIRELKNTMTRAVLVADAAIEPEHILFPPVPGGAPARTQAAAAPPGGDERARIHWALEQSAGNQKEAAKLLGISRRTLLNRLDEHAIPRPRKKNG